MIRLILRWFFILDTKKFAFGALFLSSTTYIVAVVGVLRSLIFAKYMSPSELGLIGTILVIIDYCSFLHFGLLWTFDRKYPELKGAGKDGECFGLLHICSIFHAFITLLVIASTLCYSFVFNYGELDFYIWLMVGLTVGLQIVYLFGNDVYRVQRRPFHYAFSQMISPLVSFFFILVIVFWGDLTVWLVAASLVLGRLCGVAYSGRNIILSLAEYKDRIIRISVSIKDLAPTAINLLLYNLVVLLSNSMDRLFGALLLTQSQFGYYTLALFVFRAGAIPFNALFSLFYPELVRKNSKDKMNKEELLILVRQINSALSIITPVIIVGGTAILPVIINNFFTEYVESIRIIEIILPALNFSAMYVASSSYMLAMEKERLMVRLVMYVVGIVLILYAILYLLTGGVALNQLAIMFVFSMFLTNTVLLAVALRMLETRWIIEALDFNRALIIAGIAWWSVKYHFYVEEPFFSLTLFFVMYTFGNFMFNRKSLICCITFSFQMFSRKQKGYS